MKELEDKVYILMGKHGRVEAAKMIGVSFATLISRLEKGGWKYTEIELINKLSD